MATKITCDLTGKLIPSPAQNHQPREGAAGQGSGRRPTGRRVRLFAVQQKVVDYHVERGEGHGHTWHHVENDWEEADQRTARRLDALDRNDRADEHGCIRGWCRVDYRIRWEFVTACFTEAGCQEFIRANGHNLREPRIYAYSGWRNQEWQDVREHLLSLEGEGRSPDGANTRALVYALRACEENLRLIHEAAGPVPPGAPMPSHCTFAAWHLAYRALGMDTRKEVSHG